ncbi:MAG: nitroreductase family protein [Candidatus Thorarchaeota archaeon]|jgi:nitroreductase
MMNPVIEAINRRRSIRSYEPTPIPRDIINTIIEAGNLAPSRGRMEEGVILFQPWRFVVIEDPEFKGKLVQTTNPFWKQAMESIKETHPETYENSMKLYEVMDEPKDMVYYSAPVIPFIIGPASYAVSCALACENIILAAQSLGLGSCYVGFGSMIKGNAEILKALDLTDDERIYGPIVLGYPKDIPEERALRSRKKEPVIKWI